MAQNNKINFQLDFKKGDTSALESIKKDLQEIQRLAGDYEFAAGSSPKDLQKMIEAARALDSALTQAFDVNLNTVNIQKFNNILKQSGYNAKTLQADLAIAGYTGEKAFLNMTTQLMKFGTVTKQTSKFLDGIATSFFNTVKWGVMSSIVNNISGTVQKSYYYVKDLDSALNDIRIVTGKSADEMSRFAEQANDAAKSLAVTTKDYTEGSLIYYQQGLDDSTVKTLTDITAKTSNVTGQSMEVVSEQLTAVWNGYKVANEAAEEGMQVYEEYVDKMAAVGATTASDLQELSTAMSKVASAASSMGVTFDDLNAQIATIVSVTRQAPESVGTALKTIYARLGDLKVDGVDEFGVKLGEVTTKLQTMGINILDQNGNMRQMSSVMAEVAEKWDTWTSAQRQAAAVAMAGKRQYNNLVALFDNWDMYGEALETSLNAAGTLEKQQEIAMDSLANKMDVLKATAEDLYDSLFDTDTIVDFVEAGTGALQFFADFADAVGGLNNILPMLGSIGLQVFGEQIGRGISNIVINARNAKTELENINAAQQQLAALFNDSNFASGAIVNATPQIAENYQEFVGFYREMAQYQSIMNKEQKDEYENLLKMKQAAGDLLIEVEHQQAAWSNAYGNLRIANKDIGKNLEDTKAITQEMKILGDAAAYFREQIAGNWGDTYGDEISAIDEISKKLGISEERAKAFYRTIKSSGDVDAGLEKVADLCDRMNNELSEMGANAAKAKNLNNAFKELGSTMTQNLSTQQFVTNLTKTIGAIGQLASSIQTLKNLGNIWDNEDISITDKMLQTLINISFVLPNLISSFTTFGKVTGYTTGILSTFQAKSALNNSIALLNAAGYNIEKKALQGKTEQEIEDILITEYLAKNEIKLNGARLTSVASLNAEQKQILLDSMAKATNDSATKKLTASQLALNKSLLLMNVNPVVAGVAVLVATIAAVALAYNKANKEQLEFAKNQIEKTKAIQEEIDANQKLYKEYSKTFEAYEQGNATKEELLTSTEAVCSAYDIEINKLDVLTDKYQNLTKEINEKRQAELREAQENLTRQKTAQNISAFQTAREGTGRKIGDRYQLDLWSAVSTDAYDYTFAEILKEYTSNEFKRFDGNLGFSIDYGNMDQMLQLYDELTEASNVYIETVGEEEASRSDVFKNLNEWLSRVGPEVEDYKATIEQLKETNALYELSKIDFSSIESLDEYNKKVEETANTLTQYGYSQEEAIELAKKYAGQINSTTKDLSFQESIIEAIADRTKTSIEEIHQWWDNLPEEDKQLILEGKVDFTYISNVDTIKDEIEFARNKLQTFDVTELTSLSGTLASGSKLKKDDNEILENLENSNAEAMAGFNEKSTLHQLDVIDEITQKRIAANQEYLENTQQVIQEEIDLRKKEQEDIFKTQEEYNAALEKVKDPNISEEERKEIQEIIDKYIELELEIDNLNKIKEEGLSWEEIDTLGFENLIAKIDMVTNKAESLKSAAELIGEGFTVAASDVEKFANTFPELLNEMEVLSDGSLQLNKEVVQENIEGIRAELEARTEAQLAEIDQQIALKELDKEFLEKKLQATENYLKGETDATTAINSIKAISQQYQEGLLELTGEEIGELTNYSIDSSNIEAKALVENLDQIGKAFSLVAKAHYAMINGEDFDWTGINFAGTAANAEEYASSLGGKAESQRAYAQEQYDAIYQSALETQKQLNQTNGELDELYAKRAVLESTGNASLNALDRVSQGKAGKEDKSSSSKDKKDKEKKLLEDEFNRYFDIEKAIEAVDRQVSLLEEHQKNLHGKELIDSLKQENELIEKQTENYKKLYEAQQEEAKELGAILKGKGLEFTDDGAISNYAEATTAALAKYNAAVDAYNAGMMDDAAFEIQEKAYERFKKQLERYEELYYKEMTDTFDKIDENNRKVLDNNLKAWETEIQVQLDLNEAEREWGKFFKEIGTDFKKVFKDLRAEIKAIAAEAKTYQSDVTVDIKAINDTMSEIDKLNADQATDHTQAISQAQEKLRDLNEQLMDHASSLHKAVEDAWDAYLEGIDQAAEKFDKLNDQFDRINNQLEFQGELIELMYGEKAYDLMDKLYEGQEHASRNQIQSVQQQLDFWKKLYNETSEGDKDHEKALEKMNELQDKLNDLTLDYIKTLKNEYGNAIDKILDDLNKKLTGGKGSDWLTEEWERVSNFSDIYFDGLEKAYHIQTLANKVEKDISKTYKENVKAQQKLAKYRDIEITRLKDIKNLRQEDLDIAEAKYDLILKEIALEESRNNKNTMKLVRNEQGNWAYQYVADEEEEDNRQQDKLDSNYNLYEIANNAYNAVINEQLKAATDYTNQMRDLQMNEAIGEEEKNARMAALRDSFIEESEIRQEKANDYFNELRVAGTALGIELYDQDETAFAGMLDDELQYLNTFITTEKTDYLSLEEAFRTNCTNMDMISRSLMENTRVDWTQSAEMLEALWNGDEDSVRVAVENAYSAMQDATQEYEDKITELEELVRMKFYGKEGEENIVNSIKMAEDETDILRDKTEVLVKSSGEMLEDLRKDLDETTKEWDSMASAIQNAINKLAAYLQMQGKSFSIPSPSVNIPEAKTDTGNVAGSASAGKSYAKTGRFSPPPNNSEEDTTRIVVNYRPGYGEIRGEEYVVENSKVNDIIKDLVTNEDAHGYYINEDGKTTEFKTGGYTGNWNGDNGKLAVLHKKEMVLNADDTEKLLNTVSIMRNLQNKALDTAYQMAAIRTQMNASSYSGGVSSVQTDTGSTFYIDRLEFPNANSVEEIKTAIMSLPNVASQYVNRNVK